MALIQHQWLASADIANDEASEQIYLYIISILWGVLMDLQLTFRPSS
jgi:hypothetical protein